MTFESRGQAFEAEFQHDQELLFRIQNRRNKLLGLWAAELMGLTGSAVDAYAKDALEKSTKAEVKELVRTGKVLPVQEEAMVELALSSREMFDKLVPENAIVSLSEEGVTTHEQPASEALQADIDRLVGLANSTTQKKKS